MCPIRKRRCKTACRIIFAVSLQFNNPMVHAHIDTLLRSFVYSKISKCSLQAAVGVRHRAGAPRVLRIVGYHRNCRDLEYEYINEVYQH
jgi:hypothetical protein